ncbi:MAG: TolC family protein [Betaproteobacteria bacterium]|nr:TolC family protein [Betaproteobacteria bacterium]
MRCNCLGRALCAVLLVSAPAAASPTLKDALDSAWARHPLSLAAAARVDERAARHDVASSWLAEGPRVSISQKSDRWNRNAGAREWEAEVGVALQMPAVRAARGVVAESEAALLESQAAAEKWRLAGDVRESYWHARMAASDLTLAERKVADARALSVDVERRYQAGEVARTDWNQALAALKGAESAAADARARASRAQRGVLTVTGLSQMPGGEEARQGPVSLELHPQLRELANAAGASLARQQEAGAQRRDPPEVSLGTVRERGAYGEPAAGSMVLRLTVPLAAGASNRARVAAAGAERIEAEARVQLARARIEAELASAEEDLAQLAHQVTHAEARLVLSRETHALLDKAYRLGELDLSARLRAEADRFDAEFALARAELERSRGISRFNQASGFLP